MKCDARDVDETIRVIIVTWLNHECAMTQSHKQHASVMSVTCLSHTRDMAHARVTHATSTRRSVYSPFLYTPMKNWKPISSCVCVCVCVVCVRVCVLCACSSFVSVFVWVQICVAVNFSKWTVHSTDTHTAHTKTRMHTDTHAHRHYGVATISRLLKIIGLFCRISSLLFCKRDLWFQGAY